jgi:hypothetical protein
MRKSSARIVRLAIFTILISAWCSGCLFEPPKRTLTLEEEMMLKKQAEQTYSLPIDRQGLAQQQVECNREILEEKDVAEHDILLNILSDRKCEALEQTTQSGVLKDNGRMIDAVIDKNLKDALDKSK